MNMSQALIFVIFTYILFCLIEFTSGDSSEEKRFKQLEQLIARQRPGGHPRPNPRHASPRIPERSSFLDDHDADDEVDIVGNVPDVHYGYAIPSYASGDGSISRDGPMLVYAQRIPLLNRKQRITYSRSNPARSTYTSADDGKDDPKPSPKQRKATADNNEEDNKEQDPTSVQRPPARRSTTRKLTKNGGTSMQNDPDVIEIVTETSEDTTIADVLETTVDVEGTTQISQEETTDFATDLDSDPNAPLSEPEPESETTEETSYQRPGKRPVAPREERTTDYPPEIPQKNENEEPATSVTPRRPKPAITRISTKTKKPIRETKPTTRSSDDAYGDSKTTRNQRRSTQTTDIKPTDQYEEETTTAVSDDRGEETAYPEDETTSTGSRQRHTRRTRPAY